MKYDLINLTSEVVDVNCIDDIIKLTSEKLDIKDAFLSIVLVNNDRIHEINKTYRNVDRVTDVISFAFNDDDISNISEFNNLGEIYISLEKARSQADEYGHSYKRELCFLVVHGLLHLLGYDHIEKEEEIEMFKLQEEILMSYGVER